LAAFAGAALFSVARDIRPKPFALFFGVKGKKRKRENRGENGIYCSIFSKVGSKSNFKQFLVFRSHIRVMHISEKKRKAFDPLCVIC